MNYMMEELLEELARIELSAEQLSGARGTLCDDWWTLDREIVRMEAKHIARSAMRIRSLIELLSREMDGRQHG